MSPKKEPRVATPARKQDESSKAQSMESKVQIEGLLDFSFVEVAVERVVVNGGRSSLSCS
jgi:hypothetical protein